MLSKMNFSFTKYQGTGNDFVMLDNLSGVYNELTDEQIQQICDRRFGVGADGLIKINAKDGYDFEVDYYNSDASKSFCGNGARCSVNFAHELGITKEEVFFWAVDGEHSATKKNGIVHLKMNPVEEIKLDTDFSASDFVLNTGSPHFIHFTENVNIDNAEFISQSKEIRYSEKYSKEGINVNFIQLENECKAKIRTYERGVEDETLSCGTGVTAAAIVMCKKAALFGPQTFELQVMGGILFVSMNRISESVFEDIYLIGPAQHVFKGEWND